MARTCSSVTLETRREHLVGAQGQPGLGLRGRGLRFREAGAGTACVASHLADQHSPPEKVSVSVSTYSFRAGARLVHTWGVAATSVLVAAARGTSFRKYPPRGEHGFRNANRASVSKRFSGGEPPRAAEQRGAGAGGRSVLGDPVRVRAEGGPAGRFQLDRKPRVSAALGGSPPAPLLPRGCCLLSADQTPHPYLSRET